MQKPIAAFISIPKNASMAIRRILGAGDELIDENHCPVSVVAERHDLNNIFTFCFSRNPYERVRSWFVFHRREQAMGKHHQWPYVKYKSINHWILEGMPTHWGTEYLPPKLTPLDQMNFIRGGDIGFIGRTENFETDMAKVVVELNRRMGFDRFKFKNLRYNFLGREKDLHKLDQASKDYIYWMQRETFEFFGYRR